MALFIAGALSLGSGLAVPAAAVEPPKDTRGSFSVLFENDLFDDTDRHYTNGVRASWLSAEGDLPRWGDWLADRVPFFAADGKRRIGYAIGQNIYTPADISIRTPQPDDRPYAGWLYGEIGLISQTESHLDSIAIELGVVGPWSLAEQAQTIVHRTFGHQIPEGWDNQLDNEPAINITFERRWRNLWHPPQLFGLETGFAPHIGGSIGNVFTYAAAGLSVRFGKNLGDDFGPPLIRPSRPGSAWFTPQTNFGWYVFAGAEGRAVARNIFLDGNTFGDGPSVDKRPLVGDFQLGLALVFPRFRIAYTQVIRTKEFYGQHDSDRYGAISLTTRF